MTQRLDGKTILLLGGCLGGFSLVAFATFGLLFLKMGVEPRWRASPAPCASVAEHRVGVEDHQLDEHAAAPPAAASQASIPAAPLLQFAALLLPRPDTRGSAPLPMQRDPAAAAPGLAAPLLLNPKSEVPGKKTDSIEFRWTAVTGAARYHLHVWQLHDGDETTLLDNDLEGTEVKVQLVHPAPVQWELQAVDVQGHAGESTRSALLKTSR